MAVKFLDWAGVQKLWAKIKANFVAKDTSGNVEVTGKATVKNGMDVVGDSVFHNDVTLNGGNVVVRDGQMITLRSEADTKEVNIYCNDDGKAVVNGGVLATTTDVANAVANAGHLKREVVSALPGVATAKENVIYMVPNNTTGNNKYDEYMLIDGAFEKTGSSDVDLSGYSTTEQMNTAISNAYTAITEAEINSLT